MIARAYGEAERAKLMMWFSACWMVPAFVGPPLAGWIVQISSWHFVFWSVLPLMAVGGLLVLRPLRDIELSPEEPHELKKRLMLLAAAVALGLALIQWAGQRLDLWSMLWAAAGLAVGAPQVGRPGGHVVAIDVCCVVRDVAGSVQRRGAARRLAAHGGQWRTVRPEDLHRRRGGGCR